MIDKIEVISVILEACPSFQEKWDNSDDKDLLYVVMRDLADHLFALYKEEKAEEFPSLCKAIERLHTEGDDYVKELATIGLLESIQNLWGRQAEEFSKYLLPESLKWWKELNGFWAGKGSYVGVGVPDFER